MESILTSVKKLLGIEATDTSFDQEVIMHINSVFTILTQLGVGPIEGFTISDDSKVWTDFTSRTNIDLIKSYIYLRVRLIFDPPQNSFLVSSIDDQCKEFEWRLTAAVDFEKDVM